MLNVDVHVVVDYLWELVTCHSWVLVVGHIYVIGHVVEVHGVVGDLVVKHTYRVFHTNWGWVSSLKKVFSLYLRYLWISHLLVYFLGSGLPDFIDSNWRETPCSTLLILKKSWD